MTLGARAEPPAAQVALVMDQGSALRATPAARALAAMLDDAGVFPPIESAWGELADAVGLGRGEAFDRLLGARVEWFAQQRGGAGGGAWTWALSCRTDADAAARLRASLKPAPRGFLNGSPVFALEHGAFELVSAASGEMTRLVIAPRGGELLEQLLSASAIPAPEARPAGVRVVYRAGGTIPRSTLIEAEPRGTRWVVTHAGSREAVLGATPPRSLAAPALLADDAAWERLAGKSVLAAAGLAGPDLPAPFGARALAARLIGPDLAPTPGDPGAEDPAFALTVSREDGGVWALTIALPVDAAASGLGAMTEDEYRAALARRIASLPVGAVLNGAAGAEGNGPAEGDACGWWWGVIEPGASQSGARRWWVLSVSSGGTIAARTAGADAAAARLRAALAPAGLPGSVLRAWASPADLAAGLREAGLPGLGSGGLSHARAFVWRCWESMPGLVEGTMTLDMRELAQDVPAGS